MAKMIVYGEEARKSLQKGIDQLANTVKGNPGPQGPERGSGQEVRRSPHHQ